MGKSPKTKSKKSKHTGKEPREPNLTVANPTGPVVGNEKSRATPEGHVEDVAESSTGHKSHPLDKDATVGNDGQPEVPSVADMWKMLQMVTGQLSKMTEKVAPVPVVQPAGPVAVTVEEGDAVEIIKSPVRSTRKKVDYLSMLDHVSRLGTKQFQGSIDPIVADEWKDRLVRNFTSTRCPVDYRKDIAVHFLEGDAHNWWTAVEKRMGDRVCTFDDFEKEFIKKYFPTEAWDRMEGKFLDLVQGNRSVREYEAEFNRLRRYVGRELDGEAVQVRRFTRGLRLELRTALAATVFTSVTELVERAANVEINLGELNRANQAGAQPRSNQGSGVMDRKRKWVPETTKPYCATCGKQHAGQCRAAIGACGKCGSKDHGTQNCSAISQTPGQAPATNAERGVCFHCKAPGHIARECPKRYGDRRRDEPPAKRQSVAPRVYELSKEAGDSETFSSITGKSL